MEDFETPENEALRNEVVWQCLGSYLSPWDLKDCRLVSKTFDDKVRGLRKWKERMQLHLTRRGDVWGPAGFRLGEGVHFEAVRLTLSEGGRGSEEAAQGTQDPKAQGSAEGAREAVAVQTALQAPQGSREAANMTQLALEKGEKVQEAGQGAQEAAEGAQVAIQRAQKVQDAVEEETNCAKDLSKVFKTVKSLTLEFDKSGICTFEKEGLEPFGKTLAFILGHCTSALDTLIIDQDTLGAVDFSAILDSSNTGLERIRGLKKLEVTDGKVEHRFTGNFRSLTISDVLISKVRRFANSVQFLGNEMAALEDLTISHKQGSYEKTFRDLLTPRVNVLKKLTIREIDAFNVEGVSNLIFPNLTHLSLRVSESGAKLCEFLGKQPDLQELTLKIRGRLSQNLMAVIKTKGANLVALTLKCWRMDMKENENWWNRDWSFLASLKKLRKFSFSVPSTFNFERDGTEVAGLVEDIISAMPKGLRKFSIRSGFGNRVATSHGILETLRSEAQKFKELEELSIVFLPFDDDSDDDEVHDGNDQFLRFIGSKTGEDGMFPFPRLRKLHLSHVTICDENRTLLGDNAFWAGLQDVSIRNVRDVSEDSLIEKLSGTEIRRLSLRGLFFCFQMSKEGVQKIVENNKCLETLSSNHPGIEKAHRLKTATYKPMDEEADSDSDVEARPELDGFGDDDSDSDDDDEEMDEGSDEEGDDAVPDLNDVDNF